MTRFLFFGAFAIGVLAIVWIGKLFLGVDALGLAVTCLIGAVYLLGTFELVSFRRATATLMQALEAVTKPIEDVDSWLNNLMPSLQNSVRLRIEGVRVALPAPVVTPYLVGLLVMLGLLGTFIGMVDTLKGAVVALEGNSELEAIRAGLAAPIEGLGLAFGTSVAGVAASAMLGLLSTISRRERLQVSQALDIKIADQLSHFSASYQQKMAFRAIQNQAEALPKVADQLTVLASSIEKMSERVSTQLLGNQEQFQERIAGLYGELNESVDRSLKVTLLESAKQLGSSIQPMAEATFKQLSDATLATQQQLSKVGESQLTTLQQVSLEHQAQAQKALSGNLDQQSKSADKLLTKVSAMVDAAVTELQTSSSALVNGFSEASTSLAQQQTAHAEKISTVMQQELSQLREQESKRGEAAVDKLSDMEAAVASHLTNLGQALELPMTRLIETASETPKAAADVIEKLRGEMTKNFERDNALLSERTRLMEQLENLSQVLETSSIGQRDAIDQLVERSAETLGNVGDQFSENISTESTKLAGVVDHFASSSAEMASLSEAFNAAVMLFSDSNNQLIDNLVRIEASLEKSTNRSDEQLAYYVSQAREIIDHNVSSHQQIIATLNDKKPMPLSVKGVAS